MRVVVDANVFVSAAIAKGASHRILQRWLEHGDFEIVACQLLLDEILTVTTTRPRVAKRIDSEFANRFVHHMTTVVGLMPNPSDVQRWTRDPKDDYLVALAREHRAEFIVTGDKDLLEWDEQEPPAVEPSEFETMLGPGPHPWFAD